VSRDNALDVLAFAVGFRLASPDARRALRISVWRELGEAAPDCPELAVLEDEDALIRGHRPPVSHYDHAVLRRAAEEAARPPFDPAFWRLRRADLEGAGFTTKEAVDVIAAIRASLGDTTTIGNDEGDHREAMEQAAAA
jgi:hypothetical protein